MNKKKSKLFFLFSMIICICSSFFLSSITSDFYILTERKISSNGTSGNIDFDIPYEVLKHASDIDIKTYKSDIHIKWTDILSYLAAKYENDFSRYNKKDMDYFTDQLKNGKSLSVLTRGLDSFEYYNKIHCAILNGIIGEYQVNTPDKGTGTRSWKTVYGIKAFFPIAKGFDYSDSDDFAKRKSCGQGGRHRGHDFTVSEGTPITAIESGTVETLRWDQYEGWCIGIRSYDKKRYYFYSHLRKDKPFADDLNVGKNIVCGDVIGYTGQTGYSIKENVNNLSNPYLHVGMQLVLNEDIKKASSHTWVDIYSLTKLLSSHKCTVKSSDNGTSYERAYPFYEGNPFLEEQIASSTPTEESEVRLPIIMYHSINNKNDKNSDYIVSPKLFEEDLIYIKKKGYTPVFMKDVISYVEGSGNLPQKPIVISFDDGYFNNYYYAYPLLRKYNMKAVISIVGKMSDQFTQEPDENLSYSHLTWDDILEMHLSGYWEIQNHSYDCHTYTKRNGVSQMPKESDEDYKKFLSSDIWRLQDRIIYTTGVAPNTFTYPFGAFSKNTDTIIREMGFKATLSCIEGVSTVKKDESESLYRLKRHLRKPGIPPQEFFTFLS